MAENFSAPDIIQLHFIAGGHPEQANLAGGAFHGQQPDALRKGQGARGHLRADDQRERLELRRVQSHPQFPGVRIEAPE